MADAYFRPLVQIGQTRPSDAMPLAGGWGWFTNAACIRREAQTEIVAANDIPREVVAALTARRAALLGFDFNQALLMGILNVTPDSFSDGGEFQDETAALAQAKEMAAMGCDIIDIGGESTRPGADPVSPGDELARVIPVVRAIRAAVRAPISIDTRKSSVASQAISAGAGLINDTSALGFDPAMAKVAASAGVPVCLMHALGDPKTMQDAPRYDNVVLDVYDYLQERIEYAMSAGIARQNLIIDPGIGFGKTLDHNLELLENISIFHGLGVPILLGASRKRFIGTLTGVDNATDCVTGSVAVALAAIAQGVQIVRVHDIAETRKGVALYQAATAMRAEQ